jgi:hypothetical protein
MLKRASILELVLASLVPVALWAVSSSAWSGAYGPLGLDDSAPKTCNQHCKQQYELLKSFDEFTPIRRIESIFGLPFKEGKNSLSLFLRGTVAFMPIFFCCAHEAAGIFWQRRSAQGIIKCRRDLCHRLW